MLPSNTRALSFDCYGTLIDWESGLAAAFSPWAARASLNLDREQLLSEFGSIETLVQSESPALRYPLVLAEAFRRISDRFGAPATTAEIAAFGTSVPDWPAFPDSAEALTRLKDRYKLIILSNVDRASFSESAQKLKVEFDLVITAEDVGSYKPDIRNFERLFAELPSIGVGRSELVHVAESLFHDHGPAQHLNLPAVWIHRRAGKDGTGATHPPSGVNQPDWEFASMKAFADATLS